MFVQREVDDVVSFYDDKITQVSFFYLFLYICHLGA